MPLYRFIDGEEFQPEHLQAMGRALDDALDRLDLKNRSAPEAKRLAKKIIELAQQGERDPVRLRDLAIRAVATPCAPGETAG